MRTLSDCLLGEPLPAAETLQYGIAVAHALREIHNQGSVYGCLNPGVILLLEEEVELAPAERTDSLSPYAAPEQLQGVSDDPRSDIFALGVILYKMATGRRAFEWKDEQELRAAILEKEPSPLDGVLPRLAQVVRTCLEKRPERRFQRAQLVAAQLKLIAASLRNCEFPPETEVEWLPPRPRRTASNGNAGPVPVSPVGRVVFKREEPPPAPPRNKHVVCPKCKTTDVRPSRPKDGWEDALAEFGAKFNRCYRCYYRFMKLGFLTMKRGS